VEPLVGLKAALRKRPAGDGVALVEATGGAVVRLPRLELRLPFSSQMATGAIMTTAQNNGIRNRLLFFGGAAEVTGEAGTAAGAGSASFSTIAGGAVLAGRAFATEGAFNGRRRFTTGGVFAGRVGPAAR